MNENSNSLSGSRVNYAGTSPPADGPKLRVVQPFDFDVEPSRPEPTWCSARDFLERIPNERRWTTREVWEFGRAVNQAADGYGMVFTSHTDPFLGRVRIYTLPLLEKVYKEMRLEHQWPKYVPAPQLDEPAVVREETVGPIPVAQKAEHELIVLLLKQLEVFAEGSKDPEVRRASRSLLTKASQDIGALGAPTE